MTLRRLRFSLRQFLDREMTCRKPDDGRDDTKEHPTEQTFQKIREDRVLEIHKFCEDSTCPVHCHDHRSHCCATTPGITQPDVSKTADVTRNQRLDRQDVLVSSRKLVPTKQKIRSPVETGCTVDGVTSPTEALLELQNKLSREQWFGGSFPDRCRGCSSNFTLAQKSEYSTTLLPRET